MANKKKIVLIVPILAHYRKDIYNYLSNSDEFEFIFFGGNRYENIKSIKGINSKTFNYFSFSFLKHKFYFLEGVIKNILKIKPDAIIVSGVDFHLIHTLILFVLYRILLRKKFYWWSQGTMGHQGKFGWLMRKMVYKLSSGILLYSEAGKKNLLQMKIKSEKLTVVNNSLNVEDYGYLHHNILENLRKDNNFDILFSGRLTHKVKLEILIQALNQIKNSGINDFRCYVIGDGDLGKYKKMAKEYHVDDHMMFLGSLYGHDAHKYFLESDLFVYPGGIGLSILHALSFGLPVITTDNFSLHFPEIELLEPGVNGDFYKDEDPMSLADIILKWKNNVLESKKYYSKNCIRSIKNHSYIPEKVSDTVLQFLRNDINK
ncbi:glycosyltransferase family 4 protein [bacterium]|nr:glycosyltransferase family 4 protein [bacterium]